MVSNGTIWGRVANTLAKSDKNLTQAEIAAATNKVMKANNISATDARTMSQTDIDKVSLDAIAPAPAPAPAAAAVAKKPPEQTADIFVIDDFLASPNQASATDATKGFNHGQTVSNIIRSGGITPIATNNLNVQDVNINIPNVDRAKAISDALDKIIKDVKANPASVDAVNLSQASAGTDAGTKLIQQKIKELQDLGVPVLIAAGNNGINTPNTLAPTGAIVVQAADSNGNTLADSGPGTIKVNAPDAVDTTRNRQTSFATPEIAAFVAEMRMMGGNLDMIKSMLNMIQSSQGGVIHGTPVTNSFTQIQKT